MPPLARAMRHIVSLNELRHELVASSSGCVNQQPANTLVILATGISEELFEHEKFPCRKKPWKRFGTRLPHHLPEEAEPLLIASLTLVITNQPQQRYVSYTIIFPVNPDNISSIPINHGPRYACLPRGVCPVFFVQQGPISRRCLNAQWPLQRIQYCCTKI